MNKHKFLKTLALANSFLGSLPIILLIVYLSKIKESFFYGVVEGSNSEQLSGSNLWWILIIISASSLIFGAFLGIYLYKSTKERKYVWLTIISGFVFYWFTFIKYPKNIMNRKLWDVILIVLLFFGASGGMLSLGFAAKESTNVVAMDSIDSSSASAFSDTPSFSLDPKEQNVIEIFSDGFDFNKFSSTMDDEKWESLKNFVYFPNLVETGFFTSISTPDLFKGDSQYSKEFHVNQSMWKYNDDAKAFAQKNHIGNINSGGNTFENSWSGDWKWMHKKFPDVNVMNWVLANNLIGGSDFYNYAPEYAPYKAFIETMKGGGSKASYSFLSDHITHHPYHVSESGEFTYAGSERKSYIALENFLCQLKEKLISIVDPNFPGMNAYDNTTIYVYGDHASHELDFPAFNTQQTNMKKNISALFIKPTKNFESYAVQRKNINRDRVIFSPFIRRIIRKSLVDKQSPIDFVLNNKNFNNDNVYYTTSRDMVSWKHIFTHFENGKLVGINENIAKMANVALTNNGWYDLGSKEDLALKAVTEWKN